LAYESKSLHTFALVYICLHQYILLAKLAQILGNLKNVFKPTLVQTFSAMKVYNTLVLPMLLYGSEIWTLSKKDTKQLPSIQIKIFGRRDGYTLFDHKRNEEILEQMKAEPVNVKLRIIQNKLATTCNKNEQQHDAKNSAEL